MVWVYGGVSCGKNFLFFFAYIKLSVYLCCMSVVFGDIGMDVGSRLSEGRLKSDRFTFFMSRSELLSYFLEVKEAGSGVFSRGYNRGVRGSRRCGSLSVKK